MTTVDLSGRVALITGASRGIGAAVAKAYAKAGAHIVLVARTVGSLEEVDDAIQAGGGKATITPLDMLDLEAVDSLGPALAEKFGRLDIVVGNAGKLGTLGPLAHATAREWEKVINLNLISNFRLIRTLDPLLRASDAGRAIFVTSDVVQMCPAYWGSYTVSKTALEALVKTYAAEVVTTNIRANLVSPGAIDTAMLRKAFPGGYQGEMKQPEDVVPVFLKLASPGCRKHGEIVHG
jgi:NAD(P)-dependent dehydrogenase (short-subunit alcohol dehydrogenase family)